MKENATLNVAHRVNFGGDQKTANTDFLQSTNIIHIAVSDDNPRLKLEAMDYDPGSLDADDSMGYIVLPLDTGNISGKAHTSETIIDYEVISNPDTPLASEGVYLYNDADFSGKSVKLTSSISNFKDIGTNDSVTAIKIVGPYEVVGYSDANFLGRSAALTTRHSITSTAIGNDSMSSIKIARIDGTYQLVSALNNSSVVDLNQSDGNVHLWQNGNGNNQKWKLEYDSNKSAFQIKSVANENLVLAWNDNGSSNNVFATPNQKIEEHYWIAENTGDGYFYFKNKKNLSKVLDVSGEGFTNGTTMIVWDYKGSANQKFKLQKLN
ncbi:hypothetical protein CON37_01215 [Bacillus cereus]|nr:hypothetical protein CON37_01215 [Bacillus cereus]